MGAVKHKEKVLNFFKKTPVASIASIQRIIGEDSSYVNLMLNKLVKQGMIYHLTRGKYSLYDDPTLAVFCFKPAYLGLQEALSIHNLWEQETNAVILTTKTVREGVREINGSNVVLKRIPRKLFFGIEYKQYGNFYVPVSDLEKTFLDMLFFKQSLDKEMLAKLKKKMDRKKLSNYLRKYASLVKDRTKN